MDSWSCFNVNRWSMVILILINLGLSSVVPGVLGCFPSIFNFGDSLSDTGNLFHTCASDDPSRSCFSPYGDTFFHRPTGRFSDGRLILDFIAESLGLPLLQPYLGVEGKRNISIEEFGNGLNFAVGGATALDASFLREKGVFLVPTNYSLKVQFQWFNDTYSSLCTSSSAATAKCREILSSSLVLVGEIGGNDYNYLFFQRYSLEEVKFFVPLVVQTISSTITELIKLGAKTLIVPGDIPIGCNPLYLKIYENSVRNSENGCLDWLNQFSEYHNKQLQEELERIRARHPYVRIMYADYYNSAMHFFSNASEHFGLTNTMEICLGLKNVTFNEHIKHGVPFFTSCDDPSKYVNWDGLHLTEAAHKLIAMDLLQGSNTSPQTKGLCISKNVATKFLRLD
ncbi:GDSL esterase/lipase At1g28570-like [Benincasa hispida]|uniref:GDSL esterase/lipase At1g28570-like n=1 Tax=Benincasa hispida TaxID=102211 RepID=UPI0018FF4500|nr:GDSL esterase/lipase At1g28570-like [Benincasa hispida]